MPIPCKTETLAARVTPSVRTLVEQACEIAGKRKSDWIGQVIREAALRELAKPTVEGVST